MISKVFALISLGRFDRTMSYKLSLDFLNLKGRPWAALFVCVVPICLTAAKGPDRTAGNLHFGPLPE